MFEVFRMNRLQREALIVKTMIEFHCGRIHKETSVCQNCAELVTYTSHKLEHCKFGLKKPVCKTCPVHCYSPDKKQKIRDVMRWAGPRMIYRYPVYAIVHIFDNHLNKQS